jgi:signal transduction histidine kinase
MQQQVAQDKAGTRELSLAVPLCVLLSQLQQLPVGEAEHSREWLGHNPLLIFLLASHTHRRSSSTTADRPNLLQELLNPDPILVRDLVVALLSRQAVLTSTASEERALYQWQRQQQCWLLTTFTARLLNYPSVEAAGLAAVLCLLDPEVAHTLPAPQLWRDLHETLQLSAADVRGTALLSRLVWCCHRLLRNQWRLDEGMLVACADLLGLQESQLRSLAEQTQLALKQRSHANGVSAGFDMLQKDSLSAEHGLQELKLLAQRHLMQSVYLQNLQPLHLTTAAELRLQLQRVLLRYRLPLRFLLLGVRQQSSMLEVILSSANEELQQEFAIPLTGSRSMLGSLVEQGVVVSLRLSEPGLAPVDKQLLRLLECETALCLPLSGQHKGVLLLPDATAYNTELTSLSLNMQLLLDAFLQSSNVQQDDTVQLMQQHVRHVVHEVNNPLAIIKNYLKVLALKFPTQQDAREEIRFIENEIERISRLLLTLRHNVTASHAMDELDLNEVVHSQHKWLTAAFANQPTLKISFTPAARPAVIHASPAMLTQVLLNLVKNAAEALGDSGSIKLAIKRNVHFKDKLHVLLEVSDDGPGIVAGQMQNLFQAGRSTKAGVHSGSGLAIVKKLIDEMHGQISCHSDHASDTHNNNDKPGTAFRILFPQVR